MLANGRQDSFLPEKGDATAKKIVMEPVPVERYNWLMHSLHVIGEIESCREVIKNEKERSGGKNYYCHYKQGEILRDEGKLQEALESFQAALKLDSGNTETLKQIGKCLFDMGRFKLALEAYLEAENVSKFPDWPIYYYLGQCFLRLGDMKRAKEYAHMAVKVGKEESCYALLVKILISEGDVKSAVAVCNAAVESCPESVSMLTESGLLFQKLGQHQNAFERLSSALALEPTCGKALLGVGSITQKYEEYDVALTKYKIAINYEPDSVALWNNIGMCYYSKQKYVAAISCLKRALWVSPLNWKTLFNLALAHLATSQPASAFNFICAAVNLRPDVSDCFSVLGSALMELKDPENAARAFRQAALLSPEDPVIAVNAAVGCHAAGHEAEARERLDRFQQLRDGGIACSDQVLELADKLTEQLHNKTTTDQQGNVVESSGFPGSVEDNQNDKFDVKASVELLSEFPSGEVTERHFEPDEV